MSNIFDEIETTEKPDAPGNIFDEIAPEEVKTGSGGVNLTQTQGETPLHGPTSGVTATLSEHKPVRTFLMRFIRPTLEMAGMFGGAAVATPPAVAAAPPTGGTSLAAIPVMGAAGYAAGQSAADQISDAMGLQRTRPTNFTEGLIQGGKAIKDGLLMEMVGRVPGKIIESVAPKFLKILGFSQIDDKSARLALAKGEEYGVKLNPKDVKDTTLFNWLEKGSSPTRIQQRSLDNMKRIMEIRDNLIKNHGSQTRIDQLGDQIRIKVDTLIKQQEIGKAEVLDTVRNRVLARLGSKESYQGLGENAQDLVTKASKIRNAKVQELYDHRDSKISDTAKISIPNLQEVAKEALAENKGMPVGFKIDADLRKKLIGLSRKPLIKVDKNNPMTPELEEAIKRQTEGTEELEFGRNVLIGPQGIEARLNQIIREENAAVGNNIPDMEFQGTPKSHIAQKLKAALGLDLEAFSPEVSAAHKAAKAYYGESKELLGNSGIFRMMKTDPEKAFRMVMNSSKLANAVKQTIGEDGFKPFKDRLTRDILGMETDLPLNSKTIARNVLKHEKSGKLGLFYNAEEIQNLKQLSTTIGGIEEMFHSTGPGQPNNLFVRVLNQRPAKVMNMIIEPNNPRNIDVIESAVGKDGVKHLQEKFIEAELLKMNKYGNFDPSNVDVQLRKYGTTLPRLFRDNPEALQGIKDLALIGKHISFPAGINRRSNILYALVNHKWHIGMLGGRTLLAKLYLSDTGRKLLLVGMRTPKEGPGATKWMTQALGIALNEEDIRDEIKSILPDGETETEETNEETTESETP